MTQPLLRAPTTLQPRPKANPTFSSSSLDTQTPLRTPQQSRPSSEASQNVSRRSSPKEHASDRATTAFVRRVLCPPHASGGNDLKPIEELLPPLTSSNDIDLQLYAIIAIVVKDCIYSWYGKITADQVFVEEVVRIVAHCTRGLEGRIRKLDLESLILDEIPELLENHISAYRASHSPVRAFGTFGQRTAYHELNPHPALSPVPDVSRETSIPEQSKHEADYRQLLAQGALAVMLPTEDLENTCLRTLVADVIAETILGRSIGGRASEGWFIWTVVIKAMEAVRAQVNPRATGEEIEVDTRSRLEKFGLLSERGMDTRPSKDGRRSAFSEVFWRLLQYGYLTIITVQFVIVGLFAAMSEPRRSTWSARVTAESPIAKPMEAPAAMLRPLLDFRIFSLLSTLLDLSFRMPWLSGSVAMLQQHLIASPLVLLRVGAVDGLLDQYLHHLLITHLLHASHIPPLLSAIRRNLFPRDALPPPAPEAPTREQQAELKRSCAQALSALLPDVFVRAAGLSRDEDVVTEAEVELDVWSDAYLNKHLAYQILDLVVVRVLPEMGEKGVKELMEARGIET
ncbi:MAG: hypothetical protein LQ345_003592 [Seirophora villosa]|nr:MAG: hypothetical protein LQ345_003592 [Seirophora villosa]